MKRIKDKMDKEDLNNWMDEVVLNQALPKGKGKVVSIHQPVDKETKYGKRKMCQIVIDGSDGSMIHVNLFLPEQFPMVHPKSNLGKILHQHGCKEMRDLIGKEVEVIETGDMLWKIKEGE